jgi:hypothetical protein
MRYICCQPANDYYLWQIETVINNFMSHGINPNQIDIVLGYKNEDLSKWRILQQYHNTIRFFFYKDTRENGSYIPAIYFNLMKQHLASNPSLKDEVLFLHDSDIVFTGTPDYSQFEKDKVWYLSDTNSYINYDYIMQKGDDLLIDMCRIVGIPTLIPKLMNDHSGGAQYIVKGTDFNFWDKVEKDSISLYQYFCNKEPYYVPKYEHDYPIQKWTAGMWSLLYNAWFFGHQTKVVKELDFTWSTNDISETIKHKILHNAGVTDSKNGLFFKGEYTNKLPYNTNLELDKNKSSYYYYNEVQKAGLNSPLL